mmetsp:Transcript_25648/g.74211  ORF Transcript_25648/g.74211 Transcript_25648/m.74211 type:complete len:288 (+) Transcript_25648:153-1016(+)
MRRSHDGTKNGTTSRGVPAEIGIYQQRLLWIIPIFVCEVQNNCKGLLTIACCGQTRIGAIAPSSNIFIIVEGRSHPMDKFLGRFIRSCHMLQPLLMLWNTTWTMMLYITIVHLSTRAPRRSHFLHRPIQGFAQVTSFVQLEKQRSQDRYHCGDSHRSMRQHVMLNSSSNNKRLGLMGVGSNDWDSHHDTIETTDAPLISLTPGAVSKCNSFRGIGKESSEIDIHVGVIVAYNLIGITSIGHSCHVLVEMLMKKFIWIIQILATSIRLGKISHEQTSNARVRGILSTF